MRNIFSAFIIAFFHYFFVNSATAQLKELSTNQMLRGDNRGLLNDLPKIGGWKDNTHYIIYKPLNTGYDTLVVDVLSAKEEHYRCQINLLYT